MIKKFFLLLLVVSALILVVFLSYSFVMTHEPTPSKHEAEELVRTYNLKKFGRVESSYLHTPDYFAFYNKHRIYIVERTLSGQEENVRQYAVIAKGEELTLEEEKLAEQYEAAAFSSTKDVQVLSRHEVAVHEDGNNLSFSSLQPYSEGPAFNLFKDGYKQFADF